MKNICFLFAVSILISSCSSRIIQSSTTVEKDSTFIDSVRHRKIVKERGDSLGMTVNLGDLIKGGDTIKTEEPLSFQAEDSIVFRKETKKGHLTESVTVSKKGKITFSCKEDSLRHIIDQLIVNSKNFKIKIVTNTKIIEIPAKPTQFQQFCKWFTILVFGALLALGLYKIRKLIPFP